MLVILVIGVNYRFWSHVGTDHYICVAGGGGEGGEGGGEVVWAISKKMSRTEKRAEKKIKQWEPWGKDCEKSLAQPEGKRKYLAQKNCPTPLPLKKIMFKVSFG